MKHRTAGTIIGAALLFASGCGTESPRLSPSGGSGGTIGPAIPMPVVQITPWTPPPLNDPIVLGVTISNKGSYSFLKGTPPGQSRLLVSGFDASDGLVGTKIIDVDPTLWGNGSVTISLEPAADIIRRSRRVSFEITITCQLGTDPAFQISDKEP